MSTTRRPITVVVDGPATPAWQARALSGLIESPVLDVLEVRLAGRVNRGFARRLYGAVERRLLYLGADALARVTVDPTELGRSSRAEAPGLVVWLAEPPIPGEEQHELLYMRHAGVVEPADQAFWRALLAGAPWVESEVLLRSAAGTVVVERTISGVRPFSATLSHDLALWKMSALICRATERLPGLDLPAPASKPGGPPSPTIALFAHAALTWPRVLATRLLFRRPWSVRVRKRTGAPTEGWFEDQRLVRWKPGHVYADPFLFEHGGRHHLFCEEVPLGAKRGVISHTELGLDGVVADPPTAILQQPYHLSYPFVFVHNDDVYMIPETSTVRRVELYRAVEFPHTWRREEVLLTDLDAVDATILCHGDRLWLFAGVAAPDASSLDELHLFWASTPQGPWHPHPRNPVVSDACGARPGGAIQSWGSRLIRVGQDCSRRYGGAISFREIDALSASDYAEHEVARLDAADVAARATHTYSADRHFEAIDLRRRTLRRPRLRRDDAVR